MTTKSKKLKELKL